MYIEKPKELFKTCIILPIEQEGIITRIKYDACGVELLVRYFMYGSVLHNWFYDFELELKELKDSKEHFFRSY